jgi:putative ABC transport system permease protein
MALWRQLTRGVRALVHRSDVDREMSDEVQHYLDQATEEKITGGMRPAEAARAARLELGSLTGLRQEVREYGWENVVSALVADLRYTIRRLRSEPAFTTATVLTLAVGIGATTAIFSAVNPILFESLPYPHASKLAAILEVGRDASHVSGTFAMYRTFAERARSFDAVAVLRPWQPSVTGTDLPERLEGQRVSASYFQVLGIGPVVGRDFAPSDDRVGGPNVVILSDALWRRRFAGDRAILGRQISLDDNLYTVIGVMPGGFENVLAPSAGLWAPLQYDPSLPAQGREWGHHLRTVGRLRAGVSIEQATREINTLGRSVVETLHPETYDPETQFAVASLHDELIRGVKPMLLAILGAVMLVLVMACVNVTNLLLARGVHRRAEFALRAALGAGRTRLIRQLLTESLLLAGLGGLIGVVVAVLGVRAITALSPPDMPRGGAIQINADMLAFAMTVTTLVGLAFGLAPALQAARTDDQKTLQPGARSTSGHRRSRSVLVVAEVALALVLLVSSGLLLRSLTRLFAVPVGFESTRLLTLQVPTVGHRYDQDTTAVFRFFQETVESVRSVPGVAAAAMTSQLPLSGDHDEYGASFEASPTQAAETYGVFRYAVTPGYLETLHIPLRAGRLLDEHDDAHAPLVTLISESLAKSRFQGSSPIGQRLRIGPAGPYTIVGVVGDVKQMSLALNESDAVYLPVTQWRFVDRVISLVVRTGGDPAALAPSVRQAVWSVDKDQPILRIATMDDLVAASAAERRYALIVFEAFALTALVLAAAGIYGVLAGSVAERTREIGIRSALGASRRSILALVFRQGMTLTGLGVATGAVATIGATRVIAAMLFGVSRLDPVTYIGVMVLLATVAGIACALPAWRAARVDPARALRAE